MVKILTAHVQLFIYNFIVFVDFCLGATTYILVMAWNMSQKYKQLKNRTLLLLFPPLLLLKFQPFLLVFFKWDFICTIGVCICCIFCWSWGKNFVNWMVEFAILIRLSSLSLYVVCKTLVRPSTTCATIFDDCKHAPTTVFSAKSCNYWWAVPKCGLNSSHVFSVLCLHFQSIRTIFFPQCFGSVIR